jgi:purine nucleosidase
VSDDASDDATTRLHIDTDFAGDPDDACALAMMLGWPGVEIVGITTTADPHGRRAGYLHHFLGVAGRPDIPVAVGAGMSLTTHRTMGELPDHERYWGTPVTAAPIVADAAVDLLAHSIDQGATIAAIGPYTNLALLERAHPGRLRDARVVAMGGWIQPPPRGLPSWGPQADWNVQCDTHAAQVLAATANLTLCPLPVAMAATISAADLPRLAASGPLGALLARQCAAYAQDHRLAEVGRTHPGLPDDLVNFHWDPVACAVAVGWAGAVTAQVRLRTVYDGDLLRFETHEDGRSTRVLISIDGVGFVDTWISCVEAGQRSTRPTG